MGEEAGEHLGGFVEETAGQLAGDQCQSDDHVGDLDNLDGEHLGGFVEEAGGQLAGDHLDDHRGRGDLDEGCGGIDEARGDLDEGCDFENDLDEGCHFENANFLEHGDHHYLKSNLWPIYQDCCDD